MSDLGLREWRFYLDDMVDFAGKVLAYTDGIDEAGFVANEIIYDATLRNLELIGETATHIADTIRTAHPDIPLAHDRRHPQPPHSRLSRYR